MNVVQAPQRLHAINPSLKDYDIVRSEWKHSESSRNAYSHTYMSMSNNNGGEQPLEDKELCNLSETFPTMCRTVDDWYRACEYASFYSSTVSLLPTHQPITNRVMARNRRIGVGIVDYSGWKHEHGLHKVTSWLRNGYKVVRRTNAWANDEAGVPHAIRVTTMKPGGTVPKIPGKTSGVGHPTFDYTLRRVRVAKNSPIHPILTNANVPFKEDFYDKYTDVFEWPILQGPAKPADKVSLWEQAFNLITLQREWSDNAVSNTLYFRPKWALTEVIDGLELGKVLTSAERERKIDMRLSHYIGTAATYNIMYRRMELYEVPERFKIKVKFEKDETSGIKRMVEVKVYEYDPTHEEDDIEAVISSIAPLTKSVSLLPHSSKGAYRQMPEEGISKEEYLMRKSQISPIDWSSLSGSDGIDERYCSGPVCELPQQ